MYETITHSRSARIWGHIALMRPYAWLWFDLLPASVLILLLHPTSPSPYRLLAFLIGIVLADSGVSTLNDLCDVETDRSSTEADRNTRPIVAGLVSPRAAVVQVVLLLTAAPLMMSFASIRAALVFLTAIALGVAYSVPPFRLSGRPWTSQFVWPTLGLLCYATVALFTGHWFTTAAFVYLAGVGFFYAIGETLAKDIRDLGTTIAPPASGRRWWSWARRARPSIRYWRRPSAVSSSSPSFGGVARCTWYRASPEQSCFCCGSCARAPGSSGSGPRTKSRSRRVFMLAIFASI